MKFRKPKQIEIIPSLQATITASSRNHKTAEGRSESLSDPFERSVFQVGVPKHSQSTIGCIGSSTALRGQ